ncbi:MAG: cation-transporting P-type ATPase [Anaerolineae bacterium]|nr:cation-transporting P-type ATPase [Anaerolineae bacterium]
MAVKKVLPNEAPDHLEQKIKLASLTPVEIFNLMGTGEKGLTSEDAQKRLQAVGLNRIAEGKKTSLVLKFLNNFTHLMAILLWIAGIVSLVARMPELAIAVWMVNIINGAFSFWQEFRAEKATEALKKLLPSYSRVLRDGVEQKILAEELVPGDIVLLAEGERISADCRLIDQAALRTDQSTLTGESRPVNKTAEIVDQEKITYTELQNMVFAGTSVATGTGKAVVISTGMNTEFGKIAHLTQEMKEELSPLQLEMKNITKMVTVIAVLVGIVFFIMALVLAGITPVESFIFGLGMIVAFVPEGLLPTVTLALAMGTQRMAKRNALVKKLSAVETLGCTSVICTDKTGTLTQNEMTVRALWLPEAVAGGNSAGNIGKSYTLTGTGYEPVGDLLFNNEKLDPAQQEGVRALLAAASLCNDSRLLEPDGAEHKTWRIIGDPTEAAIKVAARKCGLDMKEIDRAMPRIFEIPFDSRRKRMTTIHRINEGEWLDDFFYHTDSYRIAFIKGAPKEVLDLCDGVYLNRSVMKISDEIRGAVMQANDAYAREGLRVLAVAQRTVPKGAANYEPEQIENELVLIGLVAMMDPPRPEVAEAVKKCHSAGIRIVMITGDYGLTAESIARKVGIVRGSHPRIITGFDLNSMDETALRAALQDEVIFARVAPEHKLRVVSALQDMGQIVAVTGDGVNDAPALKKANIGVAMGLSGSDVAKEAAAMILTDDNFASIVNAIEEGRAVYANIRKFTTYIFTSNTPEAIPFILYAFSSARIPLALNVMHILSIDLGTDIVPALALGSEPPEPGVMDRPPRNLKDHVIDKSMLFRAYFWLGSIQSLATMAAFYYFYWTNGYAGQWINLPGEGSLYRSATGMALAAVVMTQIGNLFAERSERTSVFKFSLTNNRMLWIGIASEVLLVFAIIYLPFFHSFIGTGSFPLRYWGFLVLWIPSLVIVDEIRKWLIRRKEKGG